MMRIFNIFHGRIPSATTATASSGKKLQTDRKPHSGRPDISARRLLKAKKEARLNEIHSRIASGYYDRPEIRAKVADAIVAQLIG